MKGYQALRESAAWLDISDRGRIRITGEDRRRLLHAMTTNHIEQLQPGQGCYAFFLNAQGRILGDANVLCRPDHFLLDTEPETRDKLYQHLDHFIIVDDVTLEDVTGDTFAITIEGPHSADVLSRISAPLPECEYGSEEWGGRLVARLNRTGSPGFFVFAPLADRDALIAEIGAAGAAEADEEAFRVVRLEHGKPRYGEDITERYLAQETSQMRALHFSKGCYLGQEIVERVRSRGQLHRRLLPLAIDTTEAPAPGVKLEKDGKPAAEISSAAFSPALERTSALAYVRMDYKPGDALRYGDVTATVLPDPGGSPADDSCR